MHLMEPTSCAVAVDEGSLAGATGRYVKTFADLAGLYGDGAAFRAMLPEHGSRIVYEVTEFRPSERAGDLIFGVTRMAPGKVGDEYFLTRGHIHARADRPEIYHGQKGRGLMLMESPAGEVRICEIGPGIICYVPPYWLHRSINTSPEDLVMMFSYPADAGQDYDIIARAGGMRVRIVDNGRGGWAQAPNPAWRGRTEAEIARILNGTA
jgi:glucose-6-phosphate isomerase